MSGMTKHGGLGPGRLGPALYYGGLWGLGEAVLGHLLHVIRVPGLPGFVMGPFAAIVMVRVAAASPSQAAGAIFLAGAVAASLKLLDLFFPGTDLAALANPVQAILLETLAGALWASGPSRQRGAAPVQGPSPAGHP
jgi:hypothetical protein